MFKDKKIPFTTNTGEEVQCDVLFTFDDIVKGNSYVIFTDNKENEKGELQVYSSKFVINEDDSVSLFDVTDEEDIEIVNQIIKLVQTQIKINDKTFDEQ